MNGPDYYSCPVFLLYWIIFKSKFASLEEWKDEIVKHQKCNEQFSYSGPIKFAIDFIEKYGQK
jgi:hypothetical protein